MAEGKKTYKGLAVPLYGESEIKQVVAATDIITLTAASGATGDFLVAQTVGGGEVFVVDADGDMKVTKLTIGAVNAPTTAPTTGLTKGELFLAWASATKPVLGMCTSQATQKVKYTRAFTVAAMGCEST